MTDVVNVGNLDPAASAAPIPHEHSRTGLSAERCAAGSATTSPSRSPDLPPP